MESSHRQHGDLTLAIRSTASAAVLISAENHSGAQNEATDTLPKFSGLEPCKSTFSCKLAYPSGEPGKTPLPPSRDRSPSASLLPALNPSPDHCAASTGQMVWFKLQNTAVAIPQLFQTYGEPRFLNPFQQQSTISSLLLLTRPGTRYQTH